MAVPDPDDLSIGDDYDSSQHLTADFEAINTTDTPAKLELKSTSTSNPEKPRTVAAGYEFSTGTLTVVFRDGTWWNYYEVPPEMWQEFKSVESKGKYLKASGLDAWPNMGPANLSSLTPKQRGQYNAVVTAAKFVQKQSGGRQWTGDTRRAGKGKMRLGSSDSIYDWID